jgi:tetratricopeptide (TPR) repeat protein
MSGLSASSTEVDVASVRELSRNGRYDEALAAAEALADAAPGNRDALYLMAANQRCLSQMRAALATLQRLEQQHPNFSLLYQERGYCYTTLRDAPQAIDAFSRAVNLNPALVASWIMLERLHRVTGNMKSAAAAAEQVSALQNLPPEILRAGALFSDGDLPAAESILRGYLLDSGEHSEALRMLARIEYQRNALHDAELLFEAALRLAPHYLPARLEYVRVLLDRQKYSQACAAIEMLPKTEPAKRDYVALYAAACAGLGQYESAIAAYRELLAAASATPELHLALGHCLQSVGQQKDSIECYRTAAAISPGFGDTWWSLANLKTYRFSQDELATMLAAEAAPAASSADRCPLCFALGKAYEDRCEYAESWQFYERGNALRRAESLYRPEIPEANARRQIELCTRQFFAARAGVGVPDPDPIFILGLPRSGSTLIEQILASHSQVDGTRELPDIPRIVVELEGPRPDPGNPRYPGVLADLTPEDFRSLGERYMTGTRPFRGSKPFFTDKMPNNFRHIGLIHLMLPRAKIIDVRREPMACCFSNLKQLFASGQEFTCSMEDIARYYRTYLELMRHWDAVFPGKILRVFYENVVEDLEGNLRSILEFCGLEYEPSCVRFHRTKRCVFTASSEQVRQPIFREGLFQWRNYEPWLGRLKYALGDSLVRYRD